MRFRIVVVIDRNLDGCDGLPFGGAALGGCQWGLSHGCQRALLFLLVLDNLLLSTLQTAKCTITSAKHKPKPKLTYIVLVK